MIFFIERVTLNRSKIQEVNWQRKTEQVNMIIKLLFWSMNAIISSYHNNIMFLVFRHLLEDN